MVRLETATESVARTIVLTGHEASSFKAVGRRFAGKATYWGQPDLPADSDDRTVIELSGSGDAWRIRFVNVAGVVSAGDVQILVEPKIPTRHALHLFAEADGLPRLADEAGSLPPGISLVELLARWFIRAADLVLRRDLIRDYDPRREWEALPRGRVVPLPTSRALLRGRLRADCEFDEFTYDTPLNRVIKRAARVLAGMPALTATSRRAALRIATRMEDVGGLRRRDLDITLDRRTGHYREALAIARHILADVARDLEHGDAPARAFLFRTPELIEEGLRASLRRSLAPKLDVRRGGMRLPSGYTITPDLVFGDPPLAVGDVKYKNIGPREWPRPDLYQAVTFATAYRVQDAAMIAFSRAAPPIDDTAIDVGNVRLRRFTWLADDDISPLAASEELAAAIFSWAASLQAPPLKASAA